MTASDATCSGCHVRARCLPAGLDGAAARQLDRAVTARRSVPKGEALFRADDRFESIFAVQAGSFKTCGPAPAAAEHVTGFPMPGDLLGLTGLATGLLDCTAIALENSQVCIIDFGGLEALARRNSPLQHRVHVAMSQALAHSQTMLGLVAHGSADERVATFVLQLCEREASLGAVHDHLSLSMSREEAASLLGLRIETVSRCLSRMQTADVLEVHARRIRVLNRGLLHRIARGEAELAA
jgi:CRP/FNR family transcriptional regulator